MYGSYLEKWFSIAMFFFTWGYYFLHHPISLCVFAPPVREAASVDSEAASEETTHHLHG